MAKPTTFYSSILPMYFISQLVGLVPFTISKVQIKISKLKILWSLTFCLIINFYSLKTFSKSEAINEGFIAIVTDKLDIIFSQSGMLCENVLALIFIKDIFYFLKYIDKFDSEFKSYFHIDLKMEYQKTKLYIVFGLLVTNFLIILFVAVLVKDSDELWNLERFGEFTSYIIPTVLNAFVCFQFCTLVMCLRQRFRWLNEQICKFQSNALQVNNNNLLLSKKNMKEQRLLPTKIYKNRLINLIDTVRKKHYDLCKNGKLLNKIYSIQLLIIILQDLVTIIISFYYNGKYIIHGIEIAIEFTIYSVITFSLAILRLFCLVHCCSKTTSETNKTLVLIHMLSKINLKDEFKEEVELEMLFFSIQLFHQNLTFTACKIFVIRKSLFFSIAGGIATYLIIIIQFEMQQNLKYK